MIIFHIDVNSAYLSWTAVEQLKNGARTCLLYTSLREMEKKINKDMDDLLITDASVKKLTVNTLFERYMACLLYTSAAWCL